MLRVCLMNLLFTCAGFASANLYAHLIKVNQKIWIQSNKCHSQGLVYLWSNPNINIIESMKLAFSYLEGLHYMFLAG